MIPYMDLLNLLWIFCDDKHFPCGLDSRIVTQQQKPVIPDF